MADINIPQQDFWEQQRFVKVATSAKFPAAAVLPAENSMGSPDAVPGEEYEYVQGRSGGGLERMLMRNAATKLYRPTMDWDII